MHFALCALEILPAHKLLKPSLQHQPAWDLGFSVKGLFVSSLWHCRAPGFVFSMSEQAAGIWSLGPSVSRLAGIQVHCSDFVAKSSQVSPCESQCWVQIIMLGFEALVLCWGSLSFCLWLYRPANGKMVKVTTACALGVLDSETEGFFHVSAG